MCAVLSHSVVSDSATPWTVAHQDSLSLGILQAKILEWVAIPFSRDLPSPGNEPRSPALKADSLPSESPGKPRFSLVIYFIYSINSVYMPIPMSQLILLLLPSLISICSFLHLRIDFFFKLVDIIILRRTTLILEFTLSLPVSSLLR